MKSKKGAFPLTIMLVVMLAFILLYAWVMLASKYNAFDKKIGEKQYQLINTYQKAEKALFYIDQSAKYAAYQTIYDLGQKGGYERSDCGVYFGYNLWINLDDEKILKECYPKKENLEKKFIEMFNNNLNGYSSTYTDLKISINNYNFSLKNKLDIVGLAISDLVVPIEDTKNR
jgi:hypothetical protein